MTTDQTDGGFLPHDIQSYLLHYGITQEIVSLGGHVPTEMRAIETVQHSSYLATDEVAYG